MVETYTSDIENRIFRKETKNSRWRIPSYLNNDQTMLMLLHILSETIDDNHIDSVYGSFRSPWNSGRPSILEFDEDSVYEITNLYNGYGVDVQLTFNSYDIDSIELGHRESNKALDILHKLNEENGSNNSVIVSSDKLASYIKGIYPDMKITCSVIAPIFRKGLSDEEDTFEYYDELLRFHPYDEVTPRPEFFLEGRYGEVPESDRDKYVVLCNQTCFQSCPMAITHYTSYNKRERNEDYDMSFINSCVLRKSEFKNISDRCLMSLDLIESLIKKGFTSFKLQGRNKSPMVFLDMLGEYVFEPIGWYQGVKDSISAATAIDRIE